MSRWIEVDAFKQELKENYVFYGFSDLLNDFYVAIDEAPSIDLVRCAECKWDKERMKPKAVKCIYEHKPDDFCSYGERRDDERANRNGVE